MSKCVLLFTGKVYGERQELMVSGLGADFFYRLPPEFDSLSEWYRLRVFGKGILYRLDIPVRGKKENCQERCPRSNHTKSQQMAMNHRNMVSRSIYKLDNIYFWL